MLQYETAEKEVIHDVLILHTNLCKLCNHRTAELQVVNNMQKRLRVYRGKRSFTRFHSHDPCSQLKDHLLLSITIAHVAVAKSKSKLLHGDLDYDSVQISFTQCLS